ncbi:ABC transporter ATP-binding protein [Lancefieldella parvula]|uniref:ABC transporter ATP-binding protein n=1 Tax=Lancefieldella parvula TaxID=1382 RepID=UPI0028D4F50B|nr:ABC transporter ATP-binding protein [Lancefieldella parvula]
MADMYSGGSTSAIASSAPEHGKGGSADVISMSAAEVTRRLTAWISPHGGFLVLAAVSSIATVILQLWVPIIVGAAIDQLIKLVQGGEAALLPTLAQLSLVVLLASATQWLASWSTNKLTYLVTRDLRDAAHAKVANLPLSYIDTHSQGDLLSRVVNDVDQLGDGLQQGLTQFLTGVVTIIGTLCFMFYMSVPMGLVVALATPLSIIVASAITKYASSSFGKQQGYQGQLGGYAEEMVSNQELITAFAHKDAIIEQFEAINEKLRVVGERAQFASSLSNPSTRLVNNFIYALVAALGCICVLTGVPSVLTIGQVQSFLSYANQYMKPFNAISAVVTQVQTAYASARRVFDLLDAKEIKPDPADAEVIQNPQGSIEFDDVAFSYDAKHPLLSHISFKAEPGQKIALVGPTGCGKTTLINLLLRFYSIDSGAIYVDGYNTQKLTRASLREQFGMVLQDTWLFKGTIKENIRYAKPDATDEEIFAAAQKAQAHEFIQQLSQGYDTMVGESGGSLSQGQQQLLCIARVMLANPPILLLDEATSSIDTRTEQLVQKAFDTIMNGRTSLVVAHRLSTIQGADCILVLKDGSILERGTHDELLAQGGFYAKLYESQFEGTNA